MSRGPNPQVSDEEILLFIMKSPDPGFTAMEIATEFDSSRQWAHGRLDALEEKGLLKSKNPGGRARWYWIPQEGKEWLDSN